MKWGLLKDKVCCSSGLLHGGDLEKGLNGGDDKRVWGELK